MTNTLKKADHILKLILASGTIICYSFKVISGPLASLLFIVASAIIIFFIAQVVIARFTSD